MGIMDIKRCGGCHFARINPQLAAQDLSKRICYGAPPTAMQMPAGPGQVAMKMFRPIVGVSEDACALWRSKDEQDVARDDDALAVMGVLGTKQ